MTAETERAAARLTEAQRRAITRVFDVAWGSLWTQFDDESQLNELISLGWLRAYDRALLIGELSDFGLSVRAHMAKEEGE